MATENVQTEVVRSDEQQKLTMQCIMQCIDCIDLQIDMLQKMRSNLQRLDACTEISEDMATLTLHHKNDERSTLSIKEDHRSIQYKQDLVAKGKYLVASLSIDKDIEHVNISMHWYDVSNKK